MCPHMAGLLARYKRSPYGRRGRHDGFLSFALAVSEAASLGAHRRGRGAGRRRARLRKAEAGGAGQGARRRPAYGRMGQAALRRVGRHGSLLAKCAGGHALADQSDLVEERDDVVALVKQGLDFPTSDAIPRISKSTGCQGIFRRNLHQESGVSRLRRRMGRCNEASGW